MYQWYETEDPQNNMEAADHDSHRQPVIANSSKKRWISFYAYELQSTYNSPDKTTCFPEIPSVSCIFLTIKYDYLLAPLFLTQLDEAIGHKIEDAFEITLITECYKERGATPTALTGSSTISTAIAFIIPWVCPPCTFQKLGNILRPHSLSYSYIAVNK